MSEALQAAPVVTCPRCGGALHLEVHGAWTLRRCAGCGGLWLEPEALPAACAAAADVDGPAAAARPGRERLYLRCPACGEPMDRKNFAQVSGVVLDVCRAHGAWLDAGELRALRRFVRGGGAARLRWHRRREAARAEVASGVLGPGSSGRGLDLVGELAGVAGPWDVPVRRSRLAWWARAAVLAALGAPLLYPWAGSGHAAGYFRCTFPVGLLLLAAAGRAAWQGLRAP